MKPATLAAAALVLLGALVLCAQRWGYQAGRIDCGVQLAGSRALRGAATLHLCPAAGAARRLHVSSAAFW